MKLISIRYMKIYIFDFKRSITTLVYIFMPINKTLRKNQKMLTWRYGDIYALIKELKKINQIKRFLQKNHQGILLRVPTSIVPELLAKNSFRS